MKFLSTFIFLLFSIVLFTQNDWDFVFRLNTNIEKAVFDFERIDAEVIIGNHPSEPEYKLRAYKGQISNWGGVGATFNIVGELTNRFRIHTGMGYHYKRINFAINEDYQLNFANPFMAFTERVEYYFGENFSQSVFKFPIAFSYEIISDRLKILGGIHLQTYFVNEKPVNNSQREYTPGNVSSISDSDLLKRFAEKKDFTKANQHIIGGLDWQFSKKLSFEILYRYPLKDIATFEFGGIKSRLNFEFGFNYWMSFSNY